MGWGQAGILHLVQPQPHFQCSLNIAGQADNSVDGTSQRIITKPSTTRRIRSRSEPNSKNQRGS